MFCRIFFWTLLYYFFSWISDYSSADINWKIMKTYSSKKLCKTFFWLWTDFKCKINPNLLKQYPHNIAKLFDLEGKALKITYTLMNCYLVDIHWLSEALWGARIRNFDIKIKPTDGAILFAYFGKNDIFFEFRNCSQF